MCRVWRYKVEPHVRELVTRAAQLSSHCPGLSSLAGTDQVSVEDPAQIFQLRQDLCAHELDCQMCPAMLFITDLVSDIDTWLPKIKEWSWHWWHKEQLQSEYQKMLAQPSASTMHICMDFQE